MARTEKYTPGLILLRSASIPHLLPTQLHQLKIEPFLAADPSRVTCCAFNATIEATYLVSAAETQTVQSKRSQLDRSPLIYISPPLAPPNLFMALLNRPTPIPTFTFPRFSNAKPHPTLSSLTAPFSRIPPSALLLLLSSCATLNCLILILCPPPS
jgi:hypothetical protein